jgi:hypothetical protein
MAKELTTFNHYSEDRRINIRLNSGEIEDQIRCFDDFIASQGWSEEERSTAFRVYLNENYS